MSYHGDDEYWNRRRRSNNRYLFAGIACTVAAVTLQVIVLTR